MIFDDTEIQRAPDSATLGDWTFQFQEIRGPFAGDTQHWARPSCSLEAGGAPYTPTFLDTQAAGMQAEVALPTISIERLLQSFRVACGSQAAMSL